MPGVPFKKGHDPRRNTAKGPRKAALATTQELARAEREDSIARLKDLRDTAEDESIQLKAAELLLLFADGKPGQAVMVVPSEDNAADADETEDFAKLMLMPAEEKPS